MSKRQFRSQLTAQRSRFIGYVRKLLNDASIDPEDVVQDVLLRILERADSPAPEFLSAYVYRSLQNRVIDLARTRKTNVSIDAGAELPTDVLEDSGADVFLKLSSEQGRVALFRALETLTAIERQVVIGHALEGHTFAELEETSGIPINTLLSHKSRAMKKLRKQLTGRTK